MRHGNLKARRVLYEQWVRQHASELYRFAYRACGDREVAEDLVQETFYEAWKSMSSLRETDRARAWLFQILRHRYARWVRAEQRSPAAAPLDAAALVSASRAVGVSNQAERDELQAALDKVSDVLRVPLLMVFVEGLTCQQAATGLDLPLGTVLSRIHRAKRQLREVLRGHDAGDESERHEAGQLRYTIGGDS